MLFVVRRNVKQTKHVKKIVTCRYLLLILVMGSAPEDIKYPPSFFFPSAFPGFDPRSYLASIPSSSTEPSTSSAISTLQHLEEITKSAATTDETCTNVKSFAQSTKTEPVDITCKSPVPTPSFVTSSSLYHGLGSLKFTSSGMTLPLAVTPHPTEQDQERKDKSNICASCNISFQSASELQTHLTQHKGQRNVPCEVCGKLFVSAERVRIHFRAAHGEKVCSCETCGKGFTRQNKLFEHMKTHLGNKRFFCNICNRSFSQKNHLTRHSMIHTGERPYPCDFCGRGFYRKDKLTRHRRIHTGEKPYVCFTCGKAFYRRDKLTRHYKMHTGDKPFMCPVCGKRFVMEVDLKKHSGSVHQLPNTSKASFDQVSGGKHLLPHSDEPQPSQQLLTGVQSESSVQPQAFQNIPLAR
ncbi:uncharacterized protein LOC143257992 isoform X2 [Tachypleus tridentatus]|uniref:uncharacterized protein LOC143257992 isoform X2 n=1 Tax=Tachypleus tridentatus TaxID=6853 RepID=UPI003FCF4901